jgi:outer membrane protease
MRNMEEKNQWHSSIIQNPRKGGDVIKNYLAYATVVCTFVAGASALENPAASVVQPSAQFAAPIVRTDDNEFVTSELWGGLGELSGNVTYKIGGLYTDATGTSLVNSPLSELKWPVNIPTATIGGTLHFGRFWEVNGLWTGCLDSNAGNLDDSDWEDPSQPRAVTTYSTSDANLTGFITDVGVRCWALNWMSDRQTIYSIGFGAGWLYQDFNWDASNTDQWYPSDPAAGADFVPGLVATYETIANMPYVEVAGQMKIYQVSFFGDIGLSPAMQVSDEDNHILRTILAKTKTTGNAVKATLQGRYDFNQYVFGLIRADLLAYHVDGTESDFVYGGSDLGDAWSIHHEISSVQDNVTVAVGVKF